MGDRDMPVTKKRHLDAVAGITCGDCGRVHDPRHCQAHAKQSGGQQCERFPVAGVHICATHGGKSPGARQSAEVARAEDKVRAKLGKLVIVPVDNPLEELRLLAGEAAAWKRLCAEHVAELERLRYSTDGGEQIRGEIQLFERAMDRCNGILIGIAKLNLDERLVKIAEWQKQVILDALGAGLAKVGVEGARAAEARAEAARHLRAVV